jgi:hypothetical protein
MFHSGYAEVANVAPSLLSSSIVEQPAKANIRRSTKLFHTPLVI